MRRSITIAGETFPTKEALRARVRPIVAAYPDRRPLDPGDSAFILALLKRHRWYRQKLGCGVARMEVRSNRPGPTRGFWLIRFDGSETDFSWIKCIDLPSHHQDVMSALRGAVLDQVLAVKAAFFAGRSCASCPITGERITTEDCHVDHTWPVTFASLAGRFLADRDLDVETVEVTEHVDGQTGQTSLADPNLLMAWQEYHREHARLRVVSRRGNLSIARRKVLR